MLSNEALIAANANLGSDNQALMVANESLTVANAELTVANAELLAANDALIEEILVQEARIAILQLGDLNEDGAVDSGDLATLLSSWGVGGK
jgi:hypothetical protein